jgi:hypothetical protein
LQQRPTWGEDIEAFFACHSELLDEYFREEARLLQDQRGSIARVLSPNQCAGAYQSIVESELPAIIRNRDLVAYHYTRLCEFEADRIKSDGMELSSLATMHDRLSRTVDAGLLHPEDAKRLFSGSVLHDPSQSQFRMHQICMVSEFLAPEHPNVELLLRSWGGESVYWNAIDKLSQEQLSGLGRPYVVVARVDIDDTDIGYQVSKALVERTQNASDSGTQFDIFLKKPLPASRIVGVMSPSEVAAILAQGTLQ